MAVSWTDITNAQVAAGAALTTALVTALRDNPVGIAQRAPGSPKAFNVPYDYQEFTSSGAWTKPSDAEVGDVAIVQVVAGGQSGSRLGTGVGGDGGTGIVYEIPLADLGVTEPVAVGAGGAASAGAAVNGGNSSFGADNSRTFVSARGGGVADGAIRAWSNDLNLSTVNGVIASVAGIHFSQNTGNTVPNPTKSAIYGGGQGGTGSSTTASSNIVPGMSQYAGRGGWGITTTGDGSGGILLPYKNGEFPGGGGGGVTTAGDATSGAGGDGVVRVWCVKRS